MEHEFAKLQPNDGICRWEVGASSGIVVGTGQHEVDCHVALVVMQLNAGMTTSLLTMVVLENVRLVAVHLDTGGDAIDQTSGLLDVRNDWLGGVVDVRDLAEGNVLLREGIEIRLPSSRESRGMHLASTDDGVQEGEKIRRKLEAMNLERGMANNLVVVERKRCFEQRAPDLTKVVAGLHREGHPLITAALLLCVVDIPAKERFSTEDTARLGRRDPSALARRYG